MDALVHVDGVLAGDDVVERRALRRLLPGLFRRRGLQAESQNLRMDSRDMVAHHFMESRDGDS